MEQLVANANLIYKNSDVALEMKKRCVTKWEGFKETEDASGMLRQIRTADGKLVHPPRPLLEKLSKYTNSLTYICSAGVAALMAARNK